MTKRITTRIIVLVQLSLLAALAASAKQQGQDRRNPRRLQLPFDIPEIGDFFGGGGDAAAGTPCEYLELFFEAQILQDSLTCECTETTTVELSCVREEVQCDEVNVGVRDLLCHTNTFKATVPRDVLLENTTDTRGFSIESCADYDVAENVGLPDFLTPVTTRTFCMFYDVVFDLSNIQDGGLSLEDIATCGVTMSTITGDTKEICKCTTCDAGTGNLLDYGIGFDCSTGLLEGIALNFLEQCATISVLAPFAVPPLVSSVEDLLDANPTTSPVPTPPTTTMKPTPATGPVTMKPTPATGPVTTKPSPTTPPSISGAAKPRIFFSMSMVYALALLTGGWLFVPFV